MIGTPTRLHTGPKTKRGLVMEDRSKLEVPSSGEAYASMVSRTYNWPDVCADYRDSDEMPVQPVRIGFSPRGSDNEGR